MMFGKQRELTLLQRIVDLERHVFNGTTAPRIRATLKKTISTGRGPVEVEHEAEISLKEAIEALARELKVEFVVKSCEQRIAVMPKKET